MTFKDELKSAVTTARKSAARKRLEGLPPNEWWAEIRDTELKPALTDAQEVLQGNDINAKYQRLNGGSGVELRAGSNLDRILSFVLLTDWIEVKSSEVDLEEKWNNRSHVTRETVHQKVLDFLVLVANDYPEVQEPSSKGSGAASLAHLY